MALIREHIPAATRLAVCGAAMALAPAFSQAAQAQAPDSGKDLPPLRDVRQIDDTMLWIGIAIEISDECDDIAPRTVKGLLLLNKLRVEALDMGYTSEQIKQYVKSDKEKARMRVRGEKYMRSQGLDPDKVADVCKLGRDEIARHSQIGVLLREK